MQHVPQPAHYFPSDPFDHPGGFADFEGAAAASEVNRGGPQLTVVTPPHHNSSVQANLSKRRQFQQQLHPQHQGYLPGAEKAKPGPHRTKVVTPPPTGEIHRVGSDNGSSSQASSIDEAWGDAENEWHKVADAARTERRKNQAGAQGEVQTRVQAKSLKNKPRLRPVAPHGDTNVFVPTTTAATLGAGVHPHKMRSQSTHMSGGDTNLHTEDDSLFYTDGAISDVTNDDAGFLTDGDFTEDEESTAARGHLPNVVAKMTGRPSAASGPARERAETATALDATVQAPESGSLPPVYFNDGGNLIGSGDDEGRVHYKWEDGGKMDLMQATRARRRLLTPKTSTSHPPEEQTNGDGARMQERTTNHLGLIPAQTPPQQQKQQQKQTRPPEHVNEETQQRNLQSQHSQQQAPPPEQQTHQQDNRNDNDDDEDEEIGMEEAGPQKPQQAIKQKQLHTKQKHGHHQLEQAKEPAETRKQKVKFDETPRGILRNKIHQYDSTSTGLNDSLSLGSERDSYTEEDYSMDGSDTIGSESQTTMESNRYGSRHSGVSGGKEGAQTVEDVLKDFLFIGSGGRRRGKKKRRESSRRKSTSKQSRSRRVNNEDADHFLLEGDVKHRDFQVSIDGGNGRRGQQHQRSLRKDSALSDIPRDDYGPSSSSTPGGGRDTSRRTLDTSLDTTRSGEEEDEDFARNSGKQQQRSRQRQGIGQSTGADASIGSSTYDGTVSDESYTLGSVSAITDDRTMKKMKDRSAGLEGELKPDTSIEDAMASVQEPFRLIQGWMDNGLEAMGQMCGLNFNQPPKTVVIEEKDGNEANVEAANRQETANGSSSKAKGNDKVIPSVVDIGTWVEACGGMPDQEMDQNEMLDEDDSLLLNRENAVSADRRRKKNQLARGKEREGNHDNEDDEYDEEGLLQLVKCAARTKHEHARVEFDESRDIDVVNEVQLIVVVTSLPFQAILKENPAGCYVSGFAKSGKETLTNSNGEMVEVCDQLAAINGSSVSKRTVTEVNAIMASAPDSNEIEFSFLRYTGLLLRDGGSSNERREHSGNDDGIKDGPNQTVEEEEDNNLAEASKISDSLPAASPSPQDLRLLDVSPIPKVDSPLGGKGKNDENQESHDNSRKKKKKGGGTVQKSPPTVFKTSVMKASSSAEKGESQTNDLNNNKKKKKISFKLFSKKKKKGKKNQELMEV